MTGRKLGCRAPPLCNSLLVPGILGSWASDVVSLLFNVCRRPSRLFIVFARLAAPGTYSTYSEVPHKATRCEGRPPLRLFLFTLPLAIDGLLGSAPDLC